LVSMMMMARACFGCNGSKQQTRNSNNNFPHRGRTPRVYETPQPDVV
jgi:hypothetical protein